MEAGATAFLSLFADSIDGARDVVYKRNPSRPAACPTDDQAEVLVYRHIPLKDVEKIVVASSVQASRTLVALTQLGVSEDKFEYATCSEFFSPRKLSNLLKAGHRPVEIPWNPRSDVSG